MDEDENRSLLGSIVHVWRTDVWSVPWVGRVVWAVVGMVLAMVYVLGDFYKQLFM